MPGIKGRSGVYKRTKKYLYELKKRGFQRGHIPWNKNKICPSISMARKGIRFSKKHRANISKAQEGRIPWNKDKKCPQLSGKNNAMYGVHKFGKDSPHWQGGEIRNSQGYIFIKFLNHPFKDYKGYVRRSRLIMEKHLSRYLKTSEIVHHINKVKDDDRIENLMLFSSNSAHTRFHHNPDNVKPEEIIFDGRQL